MSSSTEHDHDAVRLAVLISGRGSNLRAIKDAVVRGEIPAVISSVVSNRPHAAGLTLASRAGLPTEVIDRQAFESRQAFDDALLTYLRELNPDLVVLAGFMHILSPALVREFDGRMMNIHPSLLPAFPGLRTHERALAEGATEHGASVHFVTEELDGGPVIVTGRVAVSARDTARSLADKVLRIEHRIYPAAVRLFAEGRLRKHGSRVLLDGQPLDTPLDLTDSDAVRRQ